MNTVVAVNERTENALHFFAATVLRLANIFFRSYSWSSLNYRLPLAIFLGVQTLDVQLDWERILSFVKANWRLLFVQVAVFSEISFAFRCKEFMSGYLMYDCALFSHQVYERNWKQKCECMFKKPHEEKVPDEKFQRLCMRWALKETWSFTFLCSSI